MDTPELIEEAKAIDAILKHTAKNEAGDFDPEVFLLVLSGMMTETLIEYEEPDAVMEQSFHRISQLLHVTPVPDNLAKHMLPSPVEIDAYAECGRDIARESAERLPKGLEDVHEIIIAIAFNELMVLQEEHDFSIPESLRMMIEAVMMAVVFEMGTQEFADIMIEDYLGEDWSLPDVLLTLGATCGAYYADEEEADTADEMVVVMSSEAIRHGMSGSQLWRGLNSANDDGSTGVVRDIDEFREVFDEFFEMVGLEDPVAQAVTVARTGGRMAALVSGPDMNFIQPSLAKMLLRSGLMQGLNLSSQD